MVPDRQKVWNDGRTDRTDRQNEWTDGRRQNYIPPTSAGDKKGYLVVYYKCPWQKFAANEFIFHLWCFYVHF